MIGILQFGLLAAVGWTAIAAIALACAWPLVRARTQRLPPAVRARALLVVAAAPAAIGALVAVLCFLPGAIGAMADHCLSHASGHAHLCVSHPPAGLGALGAAILAGAIAATLAASCFGLAGLLREAARVRHLRRTATPDAARGFDLVESRLPVAVATGTLRPRVLVSTGLLSSLAPPLVDAVLAHERAHADRRDGLRRLAVAALASAHFPWVRRALESDHALACEQACDEQAGDRVGDRLTVAEAILAVERRLGSAAELGALAFTGGQIQARVEALASPRTPAPRARIGLACLGTLALLAVSAPVLHDLTEHVVTHLAR